MRRISNSLPQFHPDTHSRYAEKEKFGLRRSYIDNIPLVGRVKSIFGRMGRKLKFRLLIVAILILCIIIFYNSRKFNFGGLPSIGNSMGWLTMGTALVYYWRRSSIGGGGNKFVILLAANVGGGVMEWKGAREWAIERDSVRNKRKYVTRWGYDLEIVDMSTKKRYAHEWRESWEKVDFLRSAMRKYPDAEWYESAHDCIL